MATMRLMRLAMRYGGLAKATPPGPLDGMVIMGAVYAEAVCCERCLPTLPVFHKIVESMRSMCARWKTGSVGKMGAINP